ncbi:MAG: DegT/DnrJ/EryC1/StrS family aminotransferase [Nitrososphaerota archaeon]|nr:DegT/DnrJ/EryC1/StrS family aminotransferase [Nitrososphaerota archaeon]
MNFIPINKPVIGEAEKKAVLSVLDSGMLTDASYAGGKRVQEFEKKLSAQVGVKHAVAVNSGTAALQTSLMAYNVKEGDEVIIPAFTFEATANVVIACSAKPVFADVQSDYTIDPDDVKRKITSRTKAIIPVHLYGYPTDLDEIREVASANSVRLIEDAAESLGSEYKGTQIGRTKDAACFSLYATKVITSGEGGAITTDDDEMADKLRMMRNHGMKDGYDTRILGYNFRLPEVQAAIAAVQMDRLPELIAARRKNARMLDELLSGTRGISMRQTKKDRTHIWYLYTLYVDAMRDKVNDSLRAHGVGSAIYWKTPVNRMELYAKMGYADLQLPMVYDSCDHVLSVPVHPLLTEEEVHYIAEQLRAALKGR